NEVWVNLETWPHGKANSVAVLFSANGGAWSSQALSGNGQSGSYDLWHADLGKFNPGTQIQYAFGATDANGNTIWESNDGRNYTAQVNASALDSDGDGIGDWWTQAHFNHTTAQVSDHSRSGDDPDGDGMTNIQEFLAGTDPLDAQSSLR